MSSLSQLYDALPSWTIVESKNASVIEVRATALMPSGAPGRDYSLKIKSVPTNCITVSEDPKLAKLPRCCVERHINPDSTFCLHFDSSKPIRNMEAAQKWWNSLRAYLNHQDYAEKWRRWPIYAQLSHGGAAPIQIKMEELADPLGWRDELLASVFRNDGWLAGPLPRLTRDKRGLVNRRSPCPRGCLVLHHPLCSQACALKRCFDGCRKQHRRIVRAACPYRSIVETLVVLESQRRAKEEQVIAELVEEGVDCCGTMENCPLSN